MTEKTILLSEVPENEELSYEDGSFTLTPSELRKRIEEGEGLQNHTWYVCTPQRWNPDAKYMLDRYIEDEYNNGMYEEWDARASECLCQEHYDKIQAVLDDAFKDDYVTKYWTLDGARVIID